MAEPFHCDARAGTAPLHPLAAPDCPMPAGSQAPFLRPASGVRPLTAREAAERDVREAEALLRSSERVLVGAQAGIAEANRTHTQAITGRRGVVYIPAKPFSAERIRARKSAAFALLNLRRLQLRDARRRVAEARAALDALPPAEAPAPVRVGLAQRLP